MVINWNLAGCVIIYRLDISLSFIITELFRLTLYLEKISNKVSKC